MATKTLELEATVDENGVLHLDADVSTGFPKGKRRVFLRVEQDSKPRQPTPEEWVEIEKVLEQFPEEKYTWQPTPDIRTWAQLVAHMTDDANINCWMIAGLPAAPASVERGSPAPDKKSKADLAAGFHAAIDVCQKAFSNLTQTNMMEPAGGRGNNSKLGQLVTITAHANEHYGNMVTYMRLQKLVPPSSQGGGPSMGAPRGGGMPGR